MPTGPTVPLHAAGTPLHAGTSGVAEVAVHLSIGTIRVGLGGLLALALVALVDRRGGLGLRPVWRFVRGRPRARRVLFAGIVSLIVATHVGLGAYWMQYFYGWVDWVKVLGSGAASRLPLFVVLGAYVTVLAGTFDGLVPDRTAALGTTGGVASLAAVLLACPSCGVALFLLLASAGLVGASTLSLLRYLNPVQAYAGYFAILGTFLMVVGIYLLSTGRCRRLATPDETAPQ